MASALTDDERSNLEELLNVVSLEDLMAICKTITLKSIQPTNKEEAVRSILLHESDLRKALNRKKITKHVLFNYLHLKNIPIQGTLDKAGLIEEILKFWTDQHSKIRDDSPKPSSAEVNGKEGLFAQTFSEWFYSRLNEDFKPKNGTTLTEKDFMKDGRVTIKVKIGDEEQIRTSTSAQDSVYLMRLVRHQFNLFFSPNLSSEGTRGAIEQHGVMLVFCCGTLHVSEGESVGFFEQKFGLLKDPLSENNWKIQMTELNLQLKRNTQALAIELS